MNLNMSLSLAPIVALIAGVLILIVPRLLNYIVAIYLIITASWGCSHTCDRLAGMRLDPPS